MDSTQKNTFSKAEHITSKRLVDQLFAGGNPSLAVFPLRAVFMLMNDDTVQKLTNTQTHKRPLAPVSVLISVPKRRLHHAVDRNRMKRQIREAYRTRKHALSQYLADKNLHLAVAFICISDKPCETPHVEHSVRRILNRIQEHFQQQ